jgi:beta-lactamase regulating signal transducer with metallopeptidase domain
MGEPAWISGALAILLDASLKAAVVIVAVGLWTILFASASAAVRHMLWTGALAATTALLLVVPFAPAWRVGLPLPERPALVHTIDARRPPAVPLPAWGSRPAMAGVEEPEREAIVADAAIAPAPLPPAQPAVAPERSAVPAGYVAGVADASPSSAGAFDTGTLPALLFLVWVAGAVAVATPLVRAAARLRRLERAAPPLPSTRVRLAFEAEAGALGVRAGVRLLSGPRGSMPMTWGIRRPVVLLPADAWGWPATRLHTVLSHELAHIARRDALTHLLGEVACIVQWFNPFVWLAARQQRQEREHACDDRVLSAGAVPADYATELVSLARSLRPARAAALAGMAMARGRSLRGRLVAVLDEHRDRRPVTAGQTARTAMLGLLGILPLACLAPANRAGGIDSARASDVTDAVVPPEAAVVAEARSDAAAVASVPRSARPPRVDEPPPVPDPEPAATPIRGQPDPDLTVRVLRQAADRGLGDREMADLLETAIETGSIDREITRTAYLAAARTIDSDRDLAHVLARFIETEPDARALRAAVQAAAGIESDNELSDLLVAIIGVRPVDAALRETVLETLDGVRSGRDRRAVLEALAGGSGAV